jgi:hypothetical protein
MTKFNSRRFAVAICTAATAAVAAVGAAAASLPSTTTSTTTTTSSTLPTFVSLQVDPAFLAPDAELCEAYLTLQQLLLPAGPEGGEVVDAWLIVSLEEVSDVPNARLSDDRRDQVRLAFMDC